MEPVTTLTLLREQSTDHAADDLDRHVDLLREVARGERGPLLRVYTPTPTLAFGRRDTRRPGFDRASASAAAEGFAPVVRSAGGRATAYHQGTLIVDQIEADPEPMLTHQRRFSRFGDHFASALSSLGVDAAVGEIPGEYCPGEFSVHGTDGHGGRVKLVGTAQRVVAGAWLFSSVVVVSGSASLRAVTERVYADLGLDLDPATVGSVHDLIPHAGGPHPSPVTPEDVVGAVVTTWEAAGYRFA
jgi:octanoyl-[GcvH]:protein N-octanoyltransferase